MKKFVSLFLIAGLMLIAAIPATSSASTQSSPRPADSPKADERRLPAELIERTDEAMERLAGLDKEQLTRALGALGWSPVEVIPVEDENTVSTLSSVSVQSEQTCGSVNILDAYRQYNGSYLVQGQWDGGNCYNSVYEPWDGIGLGMTDTYNNPVDVPATNASMVGYDLFGNQWRDSDVGYASSYNASSVGYAMNDSRVKRGTAWFYLDRKPSGSPHYLEMCWSHNWTESTYDVRTSSVTIGYPFTLSVSFEGSQQHEVIDWDGGNKCAKGIVAYAAG
jgi:hypothetical protein